MRMFVVFHMFCDCGNQYQVYYGNSGTDDRRKTMSDRCTKCGQKSYFVYNALHPVDDTKPSWVVINETEYRILKNFKTSTMEKRSGSLM